ncbi:MAG: thioredoxin-disulfide reductase [Candidatus Marinimicrobia bacterium]|nr:thioredoxin-disulfide reductase [Candidatus Neomarinimicrobiota bacterium]
MKTKIHDVMIIGSGPAGYTAGIYTARAGLKPIVFQGMEPGGQLTTTTEVENYPGFEDGINGPEMMEIFQKQAKKFGTKTKFEMITKVDFSTKPFKLWSNDEEYLTYSVIIATGASARYLGLKSETKLKGHGVSACATCDGFFYRDKNIIVVGGGDSALEEALFLTKFGKKVTIIHRRDKFRGSKILADRCKNHKKIEIAWDSVVDEVLGEPDMTGVIGANIRNVKTDKITKIDCSGFFVAIGHVPNSAVFKEFIDIDDKGYIKTKNQSTFTNVEGVFACGDVMDNYYQQAVTSAGSGAKAGIDAEKYLSEL